MLLYRFKNVAKALMVLVCAISSAHWLCLRAEWHIYIYIYKFILLLFGYRKCFSEIFVANNMCKFKGICAEGGITRMTINLQSMRVLIMKFSSDHIDVISLIVFISPLAVTLYPRYINSCTSPSSSSFSFMGASIYDVVGLHGEVLLFLVLFFSPSV